MSIRMQIYRHDDDQRFQTSNLFCEELGDENAGGVKLLSLFLFCIMFIVN